VRAELAFIVLIFTLAVEGKSGLDARFELKRAQMAMSTSDSVASSGVRFYQKVLSKTLATSCDFYPNDSLKTQLDFKRCSSFYAILSAMERFIKEADAAFLGYEVLQFEKKNYFYDLALGCDFFQ
jgi:putative component of membrane protein insertase Oxa1/YidC/SpoIIIJ protein YidD